MAASNYMTEADTESIWDVSLDTTRFGKIGVRIAKILNFWVYDDATNQCTNTAITPMFEQLSEEILMELINAAKANKFTDVWAFITGNVMRISSKVIRANIEILDFIKLIETQRYIYTTSNDLELPSSDQGLIKRTTS